ncbi:FecCD family ABC transporter permease [Pseudacidovorax intermedius]|uniref:ABC transporter permease n=1 Tax=Pseudacidovorax intermedius TaxID=433924 RepID=A0A147GL97_9BURK|nr:iron ABC transporter permease [Pseudacidovorax intermedius]KTT13462.1 ABC transporter permease [Pseudacidovorax intermedius]
MSAVLRAGDGPAPRSPAALQRQRRRRVIAGAALLLALCFALAAGSGAYAITPGRLLQLLGAWLTGQSDGSPEALVFTQIRLPRLLLGMVAGAGLGIAGAVMQGMFRNPLADPGLVGVSSGAALAAGLTIVLGASSLPWLPRALGSWTLVLTAFAGGLAVTALIYRLARSEGGTRMALMLLAGIAINALAGAGLGFLSVIATDEQLRSLQFWLLGSLGGGRWSALALVGPLVLGACALALRLAGPLNALALGEAQAHLLGVDVEAVKRRAIALTACAVGAVTATTGVIGFIGLVAPHAVRLAAGPDHRVVLPAAGLVGAALVLAADAVARTAMAPAELPLGVLTAALGVPAFLWMLRRFRGRV